MLSICLIIRRIGIAYLRLDQAIILFIIFSNPNSMTSKRFENGASKRKKKKIENDMMKKIKPITAFLHQPLTEATGADIEVGVLTLAQKICVMIKLISQLLAFNQKKVLLKKQCRTLNSNLEMRKQPYPVKMKIQISFRIQLLQREGKRNT